MIKYVSMISNYIQSRCLDVLRNRNSSNKSKIFSNLLGHSFVSRNNFLHYQFSVYLSNLAIVEQIKKLNQFLMTESMNHCILVIDFFFNAAFINILVDPFVDSLWINLKCPNKSCEKFNAPWVSKNIFHI